jgi:hypothetical protein
MPQTGPPGQAGRKLGAPRHVEKGAGRGLGCQGGITRESNQLLGVWQIKRKQNAQRPTPNAQHPTPMSLIRPQRVGHRRHKNHKTFLCLLCFLWPSKKGMKPRKPRKGRPLPQSDNDRDNDRDGAAKVIGDRCGRAARVGQRRPRRAAGQRVSTLSGVSGSRGHRVTITACPDARRQMLMGGPSLILRPF